MSHVIFKSGNKTYAFVDRFGVGAKLREVPATGSPAAALNKAEETEDYVDIAPHMARGMALETLSDYVEAEAVE
jgi:hypothetical protein